MSSRASDNLLPLEQSVQQALRQWHRRNVTASPLHALLLYRKALRSSGQHIQKATNQVLHDALNRLSETSPEGANLLRARFQDKEQVYALSNRLNLAESTCKKMPFWNWRTCWRKWSRRHSSSSA